LSIVVPGQRGRGQKAPIHRFPPDTFEPERRRKGEEPHRSRYRVGGATVEVPDTGGGYSFPGREAPPRGLA
ncbi:hypothetical protein NHX12_031479, partial [Muraenolepis orangiensis]